jgi:hypothetical protein
VYVEFVWPAGVRSSFTKKETDPHTTREETTGLEREWPGDKKRDIGWNQCGRAKDLSAPPPTTPIRSRGGWLGWLEEEVVHNNSAADEKKKKRKLCRP